MGDVHPMFYTVCDMQPTLHFCAMFDLHSLLWCTTRIVDCSVYSLHCYRIHIMYGVMCNSHISCDVQSTRAMHALRNTHCILVMCISHAILCDVQHTIYAMWVLSTWYAVCTTYNICYVGIIHLLCCVMYDPHCTLCNGQHTFTRYCILHCALPRYLVLYAVHIVYRAAYSPLHIVRCTTHIVVMHESHSVQCVVRPTLYAV